MRQIFRMLVAIAAMAQIPAPVAEVLELQLIDFGLYNIENAIDRPLPGITSSSHKIQGKETLIRQTDIVPAVLGNKFGFRYKVVGQNVGSEIELKVVITYPSQGLHDPKTGKVHLKDVYSIPAIIGATQTTYYSFDHEWELVEGVWVRQLWRNNQLLIEKKFEVTKSNEAACIEHQCPQS
ncbi:DUF3859 domain-containing protein [Halioglobus maricola]|uniref:DUF3859 domain-containing protein n=1 Tax=Halioglobus maricola TaxID=2601894 RepID=A0A5P9NLM5_9GAMM|nr:DUF3859 domain-containing protein [Halioglobus maricola]QFU76652.1 DUF3859 domain-containing protein [Halioglobus maricola]